MSNEVEKNKMDNIDFFHCEFNLDSIDFSNPALEDDTTKFSLLKKNLTDPSKIHFEVAMLFGSLEDGLLL